MMDYNPYAQKMDLAYPQIRWLEALQMDLAARADWCVKDYKDANHPPVVTLDHLNVLMAKANDKIQLKGKATDPDNNKLSFRWWQYEEADTYKSKVEIQNANSVNASLVIPHDIKKGETIHLIFEVSDNGAPKLTRYKRVVIKAG